MFHKGIKYNFSHDLQDKMAGKGFMRFDKFIIQYFGYSSELPEERKKAYFTFLHEIKEESVASLPTIRKWFGIHEFREPAREQVFRICLALKAGVERSKEFLMDGIQEPSFQITDYEEMILMYCLENRSNYDKYVAMVKEYEKNLNFQVETRHESNTQWLFRKFDFIKDYSEQDFLFWMWENSYIFKGYSMTAQEYLCSYREMVLELSRKEMKKQLELFLSETTWPVWKKNQKSGKEKEDVMIRKYLNKNSVPEDLRGNILELVKLVYSDTGQNSILISELFELSGRAMIYEDYLVDREPHYITNKYLSDLFNIPLQNERMICVKQALASLQWMDKDAPCPELVLRLIDRYSQHVVTIENVYEAEQWLLEYSKEHKRRRKIVKRGDLLPLIHYVAQQRYIQETEKNSLPYDQLTAKNYFRTMADAVMIACSMEPLNDNFRYDWILMSCFGEEEMHSYMDILEIV